MELEKGQSLPEVTRDAKKKKHGGRQEKTRSERRSRMVDR